MLFERCQSASEGIHKCLDFIVRQGTVDVAIAFGEVCRKIVGAEDHFQPATAAHQTGKPRHGISAGYRAHTDFELSQDSSLAAREPHIAGEGELASRASRAATD